MSEDSLLAALSSPQNSISNSSCKFTIVRSQLSAEEQEALDKAVEGIRLDAGIGKAKRYSTSWLTKVLRGFGYDVSVSTIQRHVNKDCACERKVAE